MAHNASSGLKAKIMSFFITALILSLLVLLGPVEALSLNLSLNASNIQKGQTVEFTADIDINSSETLDIKEITLELSGPETVSCKFSPEGNIISGCKGISISKISASQFGYGYGYNFGYGYGYGYTNGKLEYKITLDTSNYSAGTYAVNLKAQVANQLFSKQGSDLAINNIVQTNQNTNSNSNFNDDNNGCFTKWVCSEWSACVDGIQARTCEKEIKFCSASKKPETSQVCTVDLSQLNSGSNDEEKDIEDLELSQDEVKDVYKNRGFFPSITGAVIGAVNSPIGLGAIIFIILIIGIWMTIYLVRKR